MQDGLGKRMAKGFTNMKVEDVTRSHDEAGVKI